MGMTMSLHVIEPKREVMPGMSREHVTWSEMEGLGVVLCVVVPGVFSLSLSPRPCLFHLQARHP